MSPGILMLVMIIMVASIIGSFFAGKSTNSEKIVRTNTNYPVYVQGPSISSGPSTISSIANGINQQCIPVNVGTVVLSDYLTDNLKKFMGITYINTNNNITGKFIANFWKTFFMNQPFISQVLFTPVAVTSKVSLVGIEDFYLVNDTSTPGEIIKETTSPAEAIKVLAGGLLSLACTPERSQAARNAIKSDSRMPSYTIITIQLGTPNVLVTIKTKSIHPDGIHYSEPTGVNTANNLAMDSLDIDPDNSLLGSMIGNQGC